MKKIIVYILFINIFSKILGFFREMTLAYFIGMNGVTDAYYVAALIPEAIFVFISEGIIASYIPVASKLLKKRKKLDEFTSNFFNILLLLTICLFIVGEWKIESIIHLFASGFREDILNLTISFARITMIGIVFILVFHFFSAYLQLNENFIAMSVSNLLFSIINICGIFLAYRYKMLILLPISLIIAIFSKILITSYFLKKTNYKHYFRLNFRDKKIKYVLKLSVPVILGTSIDRINRVVDRSIASRFFQGSISGLNYAGVISRIPIELLANTVIIIFFPMLTKNILEKDLIQVKKNIEENLVTLSIFLIPSTVGFIFYGEEIIQMLYQRGNFTVEDTLITKNILVGYSFGIIATSFRNIFCRVYYAFYDTKTPLYNGMLGAFINIGLNIILSNYFGISGIAYATSISSIITAAMLFIQLKKFNLFFQKKLMKKNLIILMASLVSILGVNIFSKFLFLKYSFKTFSIVWIIVSILFYFIFLSFFKIEEYSLFLNEIRATYKKYIKLL